MENNVCVCSRRIFALIEKAAYTREIKNTSPLLENFIIHWRRTFSQRSKQRHIHIRPQIKTIKLLHWSEIPPKDQKSERAVERKIILFPRNPYAIFLEEFEIIELLLGVLGWFLSLCVRRIFAAWILIIARTAFQRKPPNKRKLRGKICVTWNVDRLCQAFFFSRRDSHFCCN